LKAIDGIQGHLPNDNPQDLSVLTNGFCCLKPSCHGAVGIKAGEFQVHDMLQWMIFLDTLHLLSVMERPVLKTFEREKLEKTDSFSGMVYQSLRVRVAVL